MYVFRSGSIVGISPEKSGQALPEVDGDWVLVPHARGQGTSIQEHVRASNSPNQPSCEKCSDSGDEFLDALIDGLNTHSFLRLMGWLQTQGYQVRTSEDVTMANERGPGPD